MREEGRDRADTNNLEKNLKEAFGYDDGQLADEYDRIAAQAGDTAANKPEDEFEKILERVRIHDAAESGASEQEESGHADSEADSEADDPECEDSEYGDLKRGESEPEDSGRRSLDRRVRNVRGLNRKI